MFTYSNAMFIVRHIACCDWRMVTRTMVNELFIFVY